MNALLVKREMDLNISRDEFLEDVECLFDVLQACYGLYECYGKAHFCKAKEQICRGITANGFTMNCAVEVLKDGFAPFIQDGHFRIGPAAGTAEDADFAVRYTQLYGIPMIICRKFWYDTGEERRQLEEFAEKGKAFWDLQRLIIDVRGNRGGSDVYIWEFIKGLYGAEPDYPCRFVQRNSPLFREYAAAWDLSGRPDIEQTESDGVRIPSLRQIYVLIDEKTASSGESAVAYLKTVDNVVAVGTHTAGCFTCGNCMTVYLPHSHIPVYFGTGMVLYEKTRNIDAEGGFRGDISYEAFEKEISAAQE